MAILEYGTLYLPPEIKSKERDKKGRYAKGHATHNCGKTWDDFLSPEIQEKIRKNLFTSDDKRRPKKRPDNIDRLGIPVIGVRPDGTFVYFKAATVAAAYVGQNVTSSRNITRCCALNLKRHPAKRVKRINTDHSTYGLRWYYEFDEIWLEKIKK